MTKTERNLVTLFHQTASQYPEKVAIARGDDTISYAALERRAALLAGVINRSVGSGVRVAVFADKSFGCYIGILAILYSGNTYVPVSKVYPAERNAAILSAAGVEAIIYEPSQFEGVAAILSKTDKTVIPLPVARHPATDLKGDDVGAEPDISTFLNRKLADIPAYVLFTSGSTGRPKGVPISHANVLHYIDVVAERYTFSDADVFTHNFELTFDLSVFDLFVPWRHGAHFCVPSFIDIASPHRYLTKHKVTVWFSVPSVITILRHNGLLGKGKFPNLRFSLFCGEALSWDAALAWAEAAPNSVVENLYGPTELTISCFVYEVSPRVVLNDEQAKATVPIGQIHRGHRYLLIDESGNPVGKGQEGELCVSGKQKFAGYLNEPEKTKAAHVLWAHENGELMLYYRTGDLVREDDDGILQYIGRVDHQIKINGFRVELEEIETAIYKITGAFHVVVRSVRSINENIGGIPATLVAFISGAPGNEDDLKRQLREILPHYMVPDEIVWITSAFPVNQNGKVDLGALLRLSSVAAHAERHA
ncbi:amino acid adenylation domain-containing protein [Telmatospirillum siberiense]|nr:amino acid adenylation domain-containing protein [Telmatospirillum siberiense]